MREDCGYPATLMKLIKSPVKSLSDTGSDECALLMPGPFLGIFRTRRTLSVLALRRSQARSLAMQLFDPSPVLDTLQQPVELRELTAELEAAIQQENRFHADRVDGDISCK